MQHPYYQVSLIQCPLGMISRGIIWPQVTHYLAKVSIVLVSPLSVGPCSCAFSSFTPITSSSFRMSWTPDSSQFQIYSGESMSYLVQISLYWVTTTVTGLAHIAQLTDIFFAFLGLSTGFLCRNPFNHLCPAFLFDRENLGSSLNCAYSQASPYSFFVDNGKPDLANFTRSTTRSFSSSSGKSRVHVLHF